MARKPVKKWNPKYNKVWVRTAIQNALMKSVYGDIGVDGKKFVKEVLAECDKRFGIGERNDIIDNIHNMDLKTKRDSAKDKGLWRDCNGQ